MLRLLSEVVGRKYDYNADLAQIRTLSVEFPAVDMLAEVRKMKDWLSEKKNLRAGRGNPRLFMRNWISRAAESSRYKTPSAGRQGHKNGRVHPTGRGAQPQDGRKIRY